MSDIDDWGELVVRKLRDEGIEFAEGLLNAEWKAPAFQDLQKGLAQLGDPQKLLVLECVRTTLDTAMHAFLVGLREGIEDGKFVVRAGEDDLAELEDDLEGYLYSEDGWLSQFSEFGEPGDK